MEMASTMNRNRIRQAAARTVRLLVCAMLALLTVLPIIAAPNVLRSASGPQYLLLVPRILEAEKSALASPEKGKLVFQIDAMIGFWRFDGQKWVSISEGEQNPWKKVASDHGKWTLLNTSGISLELAPSPDLLLQRQETDGKVSLDFKNGITIREGHGDRLVQRIRSIYPWLEVLNFQGNRVHAEFAQGIQAAELNSFYNLLGYSVIEPTN